MLIRPRKRGTVASTGGIAGVLDELRYDAGYGPVSGRRPQQPSCADRRRGDRDQVAYKCAADPRGRD